MKKILALVLSVMMLVSVFAMTASAEDTIYTKWEELAAFADYPYFNAYPNGKTPTVDGTIAADEYMVKLDLTDYEQHNNKGGAKDGSLPEFINVYVHVDADNVYFGLELQNDRAANAYYKLADETVADGWCDWRFTFAATTNKDIAPIYTNSKYYNMTLRPRLDWDKTTSDIITSKTDETKKMSWGGFNWPTDTFKAAIVDATYKFVTDATDANKSFTCYEFAFTKAGLLAAHGCTGTAADLTYIHLGLWFNTIWAEPNADGAMAGVANSRVGWGYAVDSDLSMLTDLVLPVGGANYDCDKATICVAITDTAVTLPTTGTTAGNVNSGGEGGTTPPPATTPKATTTTTATPATTTKAPAATTAAPATTTAAEEKGCGSALVVSAAALIPALGVAFVASNEKVKTLRPERFQYKIKIK